MIDTEIQVNTFDCVNNDTIHGRGLLRIHTGAEIPTLNWTGGIL